MALRGAAAPAPGRADRAVRPRQPLTVVRPTTTSDASRPARALVGVLRGDRRPLAVADELLADPAGDARLRAAVRRAAPGAASRASSAPTGRSSSRRSIRVALADAVERLLDDPGAVGAPLRARRARVRLPRTTWERATDEVEAACARPLRARETARARPTGARSPPPADRPCRVVGGERLDGPDDRATARSQPRSACSPGCTADDVAEVRGAARRPWARALAGTP